MERDRRRERETGRGREVGVQHGPRPLYLSPGTNLIAVLVCLSESGARSCPPEGRGRTGRGHRGRGLRPPGGCPHGLKPKLSPLRPVGPSANPVPTSTLVPDCWEAAAPLGAAIGLPGREGELRARLLSGPAGLASPVGRGLERGRPQLARGRAGRWGPRVSRLADFMNFQSCGASLLTFE